MTSQKQMKRRDALRDELVSANSNRSRQVFSAFLQACTPLAETRGSLEGLGEALGKLPFYLHNSSYELLIVLEPVLAT